MADPYNQQAYSFPNPDPYGLGSQQRYGQQNPYAQAGYGAEQASTSYQQPYNPHAQPQQSYVPSSSHAPQQRPPQQPQQHGTGFGGGPGRGSGAGNMQDAFVSDLAAGVLQQQGENYFQRGQAFVQSKMGFLSSSNLQYHFNIDNTYVRDKLLLLFLPFLRQWTFSRKPEQISGGHRYQPPRQDVYAPDLYIPFMAVCTYVVLVSVLQTAAGKFTHDNVYGTVSSAFTAWLVHWVVIKATLYMLGIPSSVPFLEILAYAGYPFMYACLGLLLSLAGVWPYRAMLVYGGVTMGTFMVRSMKHVIFHDSPHYSGGSRHNYLLLGLALFQFPFLAYFYVKY